MPQILVVMDLKVYLMNNLTYTLLTEQEKALKETAQDIPFELRRLVYLKAMI